MEQNNTISLIASANITPSTFAVYDPSNSYQILQATGGGSPYAGIVQKFADIQGGIATAIGANEPNLQPLQVKAFKSLSSVVFARSRLDLVDAFQANC